jgi:hypothetical protein
MRWRRHAADSPLYSRFMEVIADDDDLMGVLNQIEHEPPPNVLLAGVQFLLMDMPDTDLSVFYPNLTNSPSPIHDVDQPFRRFVLEHERELVEIGRTRHTQTNEARRCASLLPAIWETPAREFHLIDVGTSAGLNLMIDKYRYRWDGVEWGPTSPVILESTVRGRPPAPKPTVVLSRTGLDLNPLDPSDPDDRRWLESLIWPEQADRRRRLRAALEMYRPETIELIAGDAVRTLGTALARLPEEPVVVMHSFALNQFGTEQRQAIDDQLDEARAVRPVWRVSMELLDWGDEAPKLTVDDGSGPQVIGQAHPHGEWVELYARP